MFGGGILGLAARLGEFCTLGALESAVYGQDQKRLRMWGIALGVAILGTFTLAEFGQVQISETIYHSAKWNPATSIFGGLLFGYGVAYAGNCGFGALARIGGGDLRALVVVIVLAIFSLMTLGGPLAKIGQHVADPLGLQSRLGRVCTHRGENHQPKGAEQAEDGHESKDPGDDQNHERTKITPADADNILADATASEHHPDAKYQSLRPPLAFEIIFTYLDMYPRKCIKKFP